MPTLYQLIDKRDWIYQPNFTRWRHRWRGKRESLKVNTEINQIYYDLHRLESQSAEVEDALEENSSLIRDGGYVDDVEFQYSNDSTPTEEPLYLPGMDELIGRISLLRSRIEDLES